jgi:hypothetical protein
MPKVLRRLGAATAVLSLVVGGLVVLTATEAGAATIPVACSGPNGTGNPAALVAAVTQANGTPAADVIDITNGPCTFTFTTIGGPAPANQPGNDNALPLVTAPLTIEGHGSTLLRKTSAPAAPLMRIIGEFGTDLVLNDLTIAGGQLGGSNVGGGVVGVAGTLTINRSLIFANVAPTGGGVYVAATTTNINNSQIQQNFATNGGGFVNQQINNVSAPSTIRNTAFVLNAATSSTGAALIQGANGTFENDTFWLNAGGNAIGGIGITGLGALQGTATIASSTFVDNGAATAAGSPAGSSVFLCGAACSASAPVPVVHLRNTIITDTDSAAVAAQTPCSTSFGGTLIDDGGNVEYPTNTCPGLHANPQVVLQGSQTNYNGGTTTTARIASNSPAIDNGVAPCPATDQRGKPRPAGNGCDSGAYETQPPQTTASGPTGPTNTPTITFSATPPTGATFACSVDNGSYNPCPASPWTPTLTDGPHNVKIRASANEPTSQVQTAPGNIYTDPSPASVDLVVDTTNPAVVVDPVATAVADSTPTLTFTVTDASTTTATCQVDALTPVPCSPPSYTTPTLADGSHTLLVTATDQAGNVGSDSETFTIDTTGPTVEITSGPTGSILFSQAEFAFGSPEAGATFECKLDGDDTTYTSCTSPKSYSGFAAGPHTFSVRGIDALGNRGAADTQSFSYDPDSTKPDITVTEAPDAFIAVDDATVEFSVSEPATITCTLDGQPLTPCAPPSVTAQGLLDGPHTIVINAEDPSGNKATPATISFTVDTAEPVVEITSGPQPITVDSTPTVVFTVNEAGATVTCELDSEGPVPCTSPFEPGAVVDGPHIITVHAVDAAGNVGEDSVSFTVQGTPPNTILGAGGPTGTVNTTTATFTFTSTEAGSTFECRIDAGDFGPCTGNGTTTYTGLTPGFHLFRVRAIDGDGNPDLSPAERGWTIDTSAPVVNIGVVPSPTNDNTVPIPFTVDDGSATVTCKVDNVTVPCAAPGFTTAALADGSHTVVVSATDAAGNTGQSTVQFTVDTVAPVVTITGGPTGTVNVPDATFTFTSEAGVTYACSLDNGAFAPCSSPKTYTVAAGDHTFAVRATDAAGNVSAVATRSWTYKNCLIKVVLGITLCI